MCHLKSKAEITVLSSEVPELTSTWQAREVLSNLSLSSTCHASDTHHLLEIMMVTVMMMDDVGDDNGG